MVTIGNISSQSIRLMKVNRLVKKAKRSVFCLSKRRQIAHTEETLASDKQLFISPIQNTASDPSCSHVPSSRVSTAKRVSQICWGFMNVLLKKTTKYQIL